MADELVIAGRAFYSRLIVGTGKYRSFQEMARAHAASGADMVTVAVRRVNLTDRSKESLLDFIDREKMFILPNTAGCYTADEAIRTARLAREVGGELHARLRDRSLLNGRPILLVDGRTVVAQPTHEGQRSDHGGAVPATDAAVVEHDRHDPERAEVDRRVAGSVREQLAPGSAEVQAAVDDAHRQRCGRRRCRSCGGDGH